MRCAREGAAEGAASAAEGAEEGSAKEVWYLSLQNDSLREELPSLLQDIHGEGLLLGRETFGNAPEAVNLWIGDAPCLDAQIRVERIGN